MLLLYLLNLQSTPAAPGEVPPQTTAFASGGGPAIGRPLRLPVYTPVHARRPRKRRDNDLLFLGR